MEAWYVVSVMIHNSVWILKTYNVNDKNGGDAAAAAAAAAADDDDYENNYKNDGVDENNGNQRCVFQHGIPKI